MSGLDDRWTRWEYSWNAETQEIDRRLNRLREAWRGKASRGFQEAREQLAATARRLEREAEELRRLLRNVVRNMEAADRRMAEQARRAMQAKPPGFW